MTVTIAYYSYSLSLYSSAHHPNLHSFPTRRSSDLKPSPSSRIWSEQGTWQDHAVVLMADEILPVLADHLRSLLSVKLSDGGDRKSTRLNSSNDRISYAVFCLKKKK